nr:hypothetical protein [Sulfitobacter mediterraneus]
MLQDRVFEVKLPVFCLQSGDGFGFEPIQPGLLSPPIIHMDLVAGFYAQQNVLEQGFGGLWPIDPAPKPLLALRKGCQTVRAAKKPVESLFQCFCALAGEKTLLRAQSLLVCRTVHGKNRHLCGRSVFGHASTAVFC